jgi:hypothetical protein
MGLGRRISVNKSMFFSPELMASGTQGKKHYQTISLSAGFGYNVIKNLHIVGAPTLNWHYSNQDIILQKGLISLFENDLTIKNSVFIGVRIGIQYDINTDAK